MLKKELTPEEKAALEKLRADPKYQQQREITKLMLEDVINEMVETSPPEDNENIFDYLAKKLTGKG
ncbi:MAG: hypothetical protein KGJ13_11395 [Patescibacteria group bacterium]|nr:hypothetical protein [Patescibacteria group bacterium]